LKTYRPARELLGQIEELLASREPQTTRRSPLDEVIRLLSEGRHYAWVGIYLAVGDRKPKSLLGKGDAAQESHHKPGAKSPKLLLPIKIGAHEVGAIEVESAHPFAIANQDRVLIEKVAQALARYLTGNGKWVVRRVREAAQRGAEAARMESKKATVGER
jgi:putative methionine-R-sulfoxide reductase with GAF domain